MNVDRILALADRIESLPHGPSSWASDTLPAGVTEAFNMAHWMETVECGTVGCVGGWAQAMFAPKRLNNMNDIETSALLGLTLQDGSELFYPSDQLWGYITPAHAAATLRHLAATGEVDWTVEPPDLRADLLASLALEALQSAVDNDGVVPSGDEEAAADMIEHGVFPETALDWAGCPLPKYVEAVRRAREEMRK